MAAADLEHDAVAVARTAEQTLLGEGTRWDESRGELLRVDILAGLLCRERVATDGALIPSPGVQAALHGGRGGAGARRRRLGARRRARVRARGAQRRLPGHRAGGGALDPDERRACDPQGRFWTVTLADDHHAGGGALYRLDRSGRTEQVLDGLTIPNGIGWSLDGSTLYLVDSGPGVVNAFDFDAQRGAPSRRRVLITVARDVGAPDGMTVDAAGDLWVAIYGGGRVHRYSPDGDLRAVYRFPARQTTCCAFAGPGS